MKKIITVILFSILFVQLFACTEFILSPEKNNGLLICGRSLEFAYPTNSDIVYVPSGTEFKGTSPDGGNGLVWKSEYSFIGVNAWGYDLAFLDGMNEAGLSASMLWMPGSEYEKIESNEMDKAVEINNFTSWILCNFSTTDEVVKALKRDEIKVWAGIDPKLNEMLPAHASIHDATGKSYVIEFINGAINIFENPNGVFTNAPQFEWHITNLRNYVNLSNLNAEKTINGITYEGTGFGSGYIGIPGDSTPPSRFIKTSLFKEFAEPVTTTEEGVLLALHLLNTVDIPIGISKNSDEQYNCDYTQWIVIKDLGELQLYFRTYDNPNLFKIDFKKMTENEEKIKTIKMSENRVIFNDVTEDL
jgi:choloylglycine hydrolase